MKIFAAFVLFFAFLSALVFSSSALKINAALEEEPVYALIKDDAFLLDAGLEQVTTLPPSYFVIVRSDAGAYYAVSYASLTGFVEKSAVELVDYEPKTKFHTAFFTCFNDTHSANIRALPFSNSAIIGAVPDGESAFLYGTRTGSALIEPAGNMWHYINYGDSFGYVYCTHGIADPIPQNVIEKVEKPVKADPPAAQPTLKTEWLYAVIVCVPAAIIMLTVFTKPKGKGKLKN